MLRTEKTHDLEEFSECSSGCQSGWTLYLGHSQTSPIKDISSNEDEEDDLSMLSDASSGPPNIKQHDYSSNHGEDFPISFSGNRAKRKRRTEKELNQKQNGEEERDFFFLEDTASYSPPLCFAKNTSSVSSSQKLPLEDSLELSVGFSANHIEVCRQECGKNQL